MARNARIAKERRIPNQGAIAGILQLSEEIPRICIPLLINDLADSAGSVPVVSTPTTGQDHYPLRPMLGDAKDAREWPIPHQGAESVICVLSGGIGRIQRERDFPR